MPTTVAQTGVFPRCAMWRWCTRKQLLRRCSGRFAQEQYLRLERSHSYHDSRLSTIFGLSNCHSPYDGHKRADRPRPSCSVELGMSCAWCERTRGCSCIPPSPSDFCLTNSRPGEAPPWSAADFHRRVHGFSLSSTRSFATSRQKNVVETTVARILVDTNSVAAEYGGVHDVGAELLGAHLGDPPQSGTSQHQQCALKTISMPR